MKRSLRSWLWRVPLHQEIDEELEFHLELRTRELVERGMEPGAARALALRRMGDVTRVKRTCVDVGRKRDREMRIQQWLEEFRADVTFAVRQLRGAPVFTLVAVITLALGIGANSAIFALVDATLLRPLPYGDPSRLVAVYETTDTNRHDYVSPLNMGTIFGRVKGGFTVDLSGAVAFLPGSQVDVRPVRDVGPLMGQAQQFAILKMDRRRGNIVVSRRAVMVP